VRKRLLRAFKFSTCLAAGGDVGIRILSEEEEVHNACIRPPTELALHCSGGGLLDERRELTSPL
jgi:hypothetical protein